MCDPWALTSGVVDMMGGRAQAIDARSRGDLEAASIRAAGIRLQAASGFEQAAIFREFAEVAKQNMAAAAVTGLDLASFDSIAEGNDRDMERAVQMSQRSARAESRDLELQAQITEMDARMEAKAARYAGFTSFANRVMNAEMDYNQNHLLDESRFDYARRALR